MDKYEINENTGWVKLYRKLLESPLIKKPRLLQVMAYCLLKVNHKETKMLWNGQEIILKPGQFITGRSQANSDLGLKSTMFDRKLKILQNMGFLNRQVTNRFSIITINNWEEYQGRQEEVNNRMNNKRTTDEQQMNTNKNDKNVKNNSNNEGLLAVASQIARILKGTITKEKVLAEIQGRDPEKMVRLAQEVMERAGVENPPGLFITLAREEKAKDKEPDQAVVTGVFAYTPDKVLGIVKEKFQGKELENQLWQVLDQYHEKFNPNKFHKFKDEFSESEIKDMLKVTKKFADKTAK